MPDAPALVVDCCAGHLGEETPCRFMLGGRTIELTEVLDRWLAPDHRYFKVQASDGFVYILRHDPAMAKWEITAFWRS